jgi:hypothetical protein
MKYMTTKIQSIGATLTSVTTTADDINFVAFPATVGNPNYDTFLVDAKLTDKEVLALKPDTWFDFPA